MLETCIDRTYDKLLLQGILTQKKTKLYLEFLNENDLKCIVKSKTCFKNPENTSIDLFLINFPCCFQNMTAICTGLSEFHNMVINVQKFSFPKAKPEVIQYRCYKNFNNSLFRENLKMRLSITREYDDLEKAYLEVLDNHAPIKTVHANHVPYMSKLLRKAIMRRSNLENKYLKNRTH